MNKSKICIPRLILGIIPIAFAIINLFLLWKAEDSAQFGLSALFFLGVGSMIWERRKNINLHTTIPALILGIIVLLFVLSKSTIGVEATKHADIQRVLPFFVGLGCALIASGFQGLKQFKSELIILFFLGIPSFVLTGLIDQGIVNIAIFTASTTAFLLSYLGFSVNLQGVYIHLPTGSVEVNTACAGVDLICYMLGLSVLAVEMFPIKKKYNLSIILGAIILAFFVNAIRVGLMAILVSKGNNEAFDYLHEGDGSLVFGMITVLIFGGFYWLLMNHNDQPKNNIKNNNIATLDNFFEGDSF
ncbi:cyanoexosortase A [Cyanobacterium aponinum UTEX 3222]|uniref:Cyanoexosortase A n=1 Tax=Cyanobacterium aponinum 0216 TaxID=2676140 RepID=A0A844GT08_9CHRO|nr:cyanoexosortase A [Cyanobacterium aponinum]MTF39140.1 cyanoexosortase A [Cyanobacterium aponinum 0216]PHV62947.1 cyanoexosortase A [Cyanobacterium aponinum IPPAS B-1201]WRL41738.1 cyanoexosortase A [Cyanobacterium aponinum UTEX 3222]